MKLRLSTFILELTFGSKVSLLSGKKNLISARCLRRRLWVSIIIQAWKSIGAWLKRKLCQPGEDPRVRSNRRNRSYRERSFSFEEGSESSRNSDGRIQKERQKAKGSRSAVFNARRCPGRNKGGGRVSPRRIRFLVQVLNRRTKLANSKARV